MVNILSLYQYAETAVIHLNNIHLLLNTITHSIQVYYILYINDKMERTKGCHQQTVAI